LRAVVPRHARYLEGRTKISLLACGGELLQGAFT
jgi:hypothetical protein